MNYMQRTPTTLLKKRKDSYDAKKLIYLELNNVSKNENKLATGENIVFNLKPRVKRSFVPLLSRPK